MPAQVPVQGSHGAFVPHNCRSMFASGTRLQHSRCVSSAAVRTCRLRVSAAQGVNQMEGQSAADATPTPQEQHNGSSNPRQKAQQRGVLHTIIQHISGLYTVKDLTSCTKLSLAYFSRSSSGQ